MLLKMLKTRKGFTILEVILSVAILSLVLVPMLFAIPSSTKVVVNTQEELELNQEMRSTIIKITDAIKEDSKHFFVDAESLTNPPTTKKMGDFVKNTSDENTKEIKSGFLKLNQDNNYKFKINGEKKLYSGDTSKGFGGALYLTNALAGSSEESASLIGFDLIFFNHKDKPIELDTLTFKYYYSGNDVDETILQNLECKSDYFAYTDYDNPVTKVVNTTPKRLDTTGRYVIKMTNKPPLASPIEKDGRRADHVLEFTFVRNLGPKVYINKNCFLQLHFNVTTQGTNDLEIFKNIDDYSYMKKVWTPDPKTDKTLENETSFIGAIDGSAYHQWKDVTVFDDSTEFPVWGDDLEKQKPHTYKTELYEISIDLYNSSERKLKTAKIVVSGNP